MMIKYSYINYSFSVFMYRSTLLSSNNSKMILSMFNDNYTFIRVSNYSKCMSIYLV